MTTIPGSSFGASFTTPSRETDSERTDDYCYATAACIGDGFDNEESQAGGGSCLVDTGQSEVAADDDPNSPPLETIIESRKEISAAKKHTVLQSVAVGDNMNHPNLLCVSTEPPAMRAGMVIYCDMHLFNCSSMSFLKRSKGWAPRRRRPLMKKCGVPRALSSRA